MAHWDTVVDIYQMEHGRRWTVTTNNSRKFVVTNFGNMYHIQENAARIRTEETLPQAITGIQTVLDQEFRKSVNDLASKMKENRCQRKP